MAGYYWNVPQEVREWCVNRYLEGSSLADTAAEAEEELGVKISGTSVCRWLYRAGHTPRQDNYHSGAPHGVWATQIKGMTLYTFVLELYQQQTKIETIQQLIQQELGFYPTKNTIYNWLREEGTELRYPARGQTRRRVSF